MYYDCDRGPVTTRQLVITTLAIGAAIGVSLCFVYGVAQKEISKIDSQVCEDLNLNSFSTKHIAVKNLTGGFVISLTGQAVNHVGKEFNHAVVDYGISEADYLNLCRLSNKSVPDCAAKNYGKPFFDHLLDVLKRSKVINTDGIYLALKNDDEIVLQIGEPYKEEDNKHLSYVLEVMKFEGKNLKRFILKISAPLDDDLVQNPYNIYQKQKQTNIQILNQEAIENIITVELNGESTTIISER